MEEDILEQLEFEIYVSSNEYFYAVSLNNESKHLKHQTQDIYSWIERVYTERKLYVKMLVNKYVA